MIEKKYAKNGGVFLEKLEKSPIWAKCLMAVIFSSAVLTMAYFSSEELPVVYKSTRTHEIKKIEVRGVEIASNIDYDEFLVGKRYEMVWVP